MFLWKLWILARFWIIQIRIWHSTSAAGSLQRYDCFISKIGENSFWFHEVTIFNNIMAGTSNFFIEAQEGHDRFLHYCTPPAQEDVLFLTLSELVLSTCSGFYVFWLWAAEFCRFDNGLKIPSASVCVACILQIPAWAEIRAKKAQQRISCSLRDEQLLQTPWTKPFNPAHNNTWKLQILKLSTQMLCWAGCMSSAHALAQFVQVTTQW